MQLPKDQREERLRIVVAKILARFPPESGKQ
jgi:hypothetical protein